MSFYVNPEFTREKFLFQLLQRVFILTIAKSFYLMAAVHIQIERPRVRGHIKYIFLTKVEKYHLLKALLLWKKILFEQPN